MTKQFEFDFSKAVQEESNVVNDNVIDFSNIDPQKFVDEASKKIRSIENELNDKYVEREKEIKMILLALLSESNAFLHGPAGTGKSQLTEDIARRFTKANYFRILMGKTTEPAEVFGPVSINNLKNDIYKVNTKGKLPTSDIAFMDEIFKCNSAVLNSLLTVMNEKLFFNDEVEVVPNVSVIGASNEFPEDDSLIPLYDRFLLKWNVNYIQDPLKRMDLFNGFLKSRKGKSKIDNNSGAAITSEDNTTYLDIRDLKILNEICKQVEISKRVLQEYNKVFLMLDKNGISVSDRRKNEALKILQASAIMNGRLEVSQEDFEHLVFAFWNDVEDIPILETELIKMANPYKNKYEKYKKTLDGFKKDLQEIENDKKSPDYEINKSIKITEINKTLNFAISNIRSITEDMDQSSPIHEQFSNLVKEMKNVLEDIRDQIII